jgi:hypothetical protein
MENALRKEWLMIVSSYVHAFAQLTLGGAIQKESSTAARTEKNATLCLHIHMYMLFRTDVIILIWLVVKRAHPFDRNTPELAILERYIL